MRASLNKRRATLNGFVFETSGTAVSLRLSSKFFYRRQRFQTSCAIEAIYIYYIYTFLYWFYTIISAFIAYTLPTFTVAVHFCVTDFFITSVTDVVKNFLAFSFIDGFKALYSFLQMPTLWGQAFILTVHYSVIDVLMTCIFYILKHSCFCFKGMLFWTFCGLLRALHCQWLLLYTAKPSCARAVHCVNLCNVIRNRGTSSSPCRQYDKGKKGPLFKYVSELFNIVCMAQRVALISRPCNISSAKFISVRRLTFQGFFVNFTCFVCHTSQFHETGVVIAEGSKWLPIAIIIFHCEHCAHSFASSCLKS